MFKGYLFFFILFYWVEWPRGVSRGRPGDVLGEPPEGRFVLRTSENPQKLTKNMKFAWAGRPPPLFSLCKLALILQKFAILLVFLLLGFDYQNPLDFGSGFTHFCAVGTNRKS